MIAKSPDRGDRTHGSKSSIALIRAFGFLVTEFRWLSPPAFHPPPLSGLSIEFSVFLSQLYTTKLGEQKQPVEKSRQPQIFNSPGQAGGIFESRRRDRRIVQASWLDNGVASMLFTIPLIRSGANGINTLVSSGSNAT